jgi:AAA15 family ATPase/GTPase
VSTLILNSLEVRRFRAFQHLCIEQLGRVNLIVGKNNVGKSCLLEAIQLYATRALPSTIWQVLEAHDEDIESSSRRHANIEEILSSVKYLFYGRKDIIDSVDPIEIGPMDASNEKLLISIMFYRTQPTLFDEEISVPRFSIQLGENRHVNYPLELSSPRLLRSELKEINCILTTANGLNKRRIAELWDKIALTNLEDEVLIALRIIAPGMQAINIVGDPIRGRGRSAIAKVTDIAEPLPIRSLGDGMQRMLGIVLALVNARDGLLLIDEIENGLHYSAQMGLWRLIFQLAHKLNVQVFVTTHSWDCITAFQQAAQEDKQEESMLIRLELKKGEINATLFDEQKLAIATHEQIEVR